MTLTDKEIIDRLADGEDPYEIDPFYGCCNPLTGYYPEAEVEAERRRRTVDTAIASGEITVALEAGMLHKDSA